ncbi:hypothetical protein ABT144_14080 [Streptomyces sp. NPDC002039]
MGGIDLKPSPGLSLVDGTAAQREFDAIRLKTERLIDTLPKAYDCLAAQP